MPGLVVTVPCGTPQLALPSETPGEPDTHTSDGLQHTSGLHLLLTPALAWGFFLSNSHDLVDTFYTCGNMGAHQGTPAQRAKEGGNGEFTEVFPRETYQPVRHGQVRYRTLHRCSRRWIPLYDGHRSGPHVRMARPPSVEPHAIRANGKPPLSEGRLFFARVAEFIYYRRQPML